MSKTSNSFDTHYTLNKVGEKSPIVFIHGVGLDQDIWKPQIDFFKDYTTLTYDLLGHGKTPLSKAKVKFNDFYRQLLSLIDELEFKKIHLVGFSLGALIAREFASKHSERLCSLIIHGPIYNNDFKKALKSISARTILMPCNQDLYFRTKDNEFEAKYIKNAFLRPIDSSFGHCAANPGNDKNFELQLDKNISELLNNS